MNHVLSGCALLISLSIAPLAMVGLPKDGTGPVIAIFAPWTDIEAALKTSGAFEIFPLQTPIAALLAPPNKTVRAALKQNGAWLILNGDTIASLCGVTNA
ncbi:MAG: hypothetical protein ACJAYH_001177 [Celeribacter sp.]|jgi:hypothetical protein